MKQTPLQELISGLDNILKNENEYRVSDYGRGMVEAAKLIKIKATELLPYEKKCIYESYDAGVKAMSERGVEVRALCDVDEWFKEHYTTSPIEFDAKKVAESLHLNSLQTDFIMYAEKYKYTPTQRQQILNALNEI